MTKPKAPRSVPARSLTIAPRGLDLDAFEANVTAARALVRRASNLARLADKAVRDEIARHTQLIQEKRLRVRSPEFDELWETKDERLETCRRTSDEADAALAEAREQLEDAERDLDRASRQGKPSRQDIIEGRTATLLIAGEAQDPETPIRIHGKTLAVLMGLREIAPEVDRTLVVAARHIAGAIAYSRSI